jgi:multidrug efflux pump subunit AcrA (membrane-fusion protein)
MKFYKIVLITLILGATVAGLFGCGSKSDPQTPADQIAAVKRGNLELDITAAGNLAFTQTEDLPVDLFYQGGTVGRGGTIGQVLVEVGDTVKKGQVLVSVDPTEWADQLQIVQDNVNTAQRNVTTKNGLVTDAERQVTTLQRTVTAKETAVTGAERQVTLKEFAVKQTQLAVQSANSTLNQITEVQEAKIAVAMAELNLTFIKKLTTGQFAGWAGDFGDLTQLTTDAKNDLAAALEDYNNIVAGHTSNITVLSNVKLWAAKSQLDVEQSHLEIEKSKLAVAQSQMAVYDAQTAVDDANSAVEDARIAVDNANYAVDKGQQALDNARLDLDNANSTLADTQKKLANAEAMSPEITAPFDGFVTALNVKAGDSVYNGTIAVTVTDPTKFEADILVSEMDIAKVKLGGEATVQVSAITGISLPAKVTNISPTATIQSGVVNYSVKVELGTLPAASQNQTATQPSTSNVTAGQLPAALQRAVDAGRMTQQQAEDFVKNGPPAGFSPPAGGALPEGLTLPEGFSPQAGTGFSGASGSRAQSQLPSAATTTTSFQLRQGLTVTVNVIVARRTNVLLVPNTAVTKEGNQSYVQVVTASGTTEKRAVQTGISDWQNTEITSGLSDGENIVVPKASTSAASTTTQSNQPRGGIPFLGR